MQSQDIPDAKPNSDFLQQNVLPRAESSCFDTPLICSSFEYKKIPISNKQTDLFYKMNRPKRGRAIVLNHEKFGISRLKKRDGTEHDRIRLTKTCSILGFDFVIYKDLTKKEVAQNLEIESKGDFGDCDCLLVVVLTHGEEGKLAATDDWYNIDLLFENFTPDKCPTLAGKPKIFVIQACRGSKTDPGLDVEVDCSTKDRSKADIDTLSYRIPLHSDFLIAYATIPGFFSYRQPQKGSWFIQTLCEELDKHYMKHDLLTILTFVNRRVSMEYQSSNKLKELNNKKQTSCFTSMLTRQVMFG